MCVKENMQTLVAIVGDEQTIDGNAAKHACVEVEAHVMRMAQCNRNLPETTAPSRDLLVAASKRVGHKIGCQL